MTSPYPIESILAHNGREFTATSHHDTYAAISPHNSSHVGHAVFVTGASSGFGRSTAIAYAQSGASLIAIGARSSQAETEAAIVAAAKAGGHPPPKILNLVLDVTNFDSVTAAVAKVEAEFGRLDILVNNAGYLEAFTKIAESDPSEWWRTWEVNVRGLYWMSRACLPLLIKGGEKVIMNISSIGAHYASPGGSGYQTTKLAVLRLTEFLNVDHGAEGILAYVVHPGSSPTALSNALPEAIRSSFIDTTELASDTVVWLTQERREWLAGRYVSCNWDMPEMMAKKEEIVSGDKLKVRMVV